MPAVEATVITPPRAPLDHPREEGVGEGDDRLAVDANHLGLALGVELEEAAAEAEAGVVDQQVHITPSFSTSSGKLGRVGDEVALDDVRRGRELARRAVRAGPYAGRRGSGRSRDRRAGGRIPRRCRTDAPVISAVSAIDRSLFRYAGRVRGRRAVRGANIGSMETRRRNVRGADPLLGGGVPLGARDALVSGAQARAGAGQPGEDAVPAGPGPDRALEGVPAPQAQDAGVRGAGGGPLPDAAHAHARGLLHLEDGRAGARAERGPDRGGRAGSRPRASAVRAHRRGGAGRGAAGARHAVPAQRALAAGGGGAGAGRPGAQPDRAGAGRDPQSHRAGEAGDAGGAGGADRGPGRVHQPRHRRRGAGRDHLGRGSAGRGDRAARGDGGGADRPAGAGHGGAVAGRGGHRAERGGRWGDAATAEVHVRAGLPRGGGAGRAGAGEAGAADAVRPLPGAPRRGAGD